MRLMAGIPRQSGTAVLFELGDERVYFSRHCIRTLDAKQRDVLIRGGLWMTSGSGTRSVALTGRDRPQHRIHGRARRRERIRLFE
jgi:hypothetical protein